MSSKYRVKYEVSEGGDKVTLLSVTPPSESVEDMWYCGQLLKKVWVYDNGVFELTVNLYNDYTTHFGIVSLEKIYG